MADTPIPAQRTRPHGDIVAEGVSADEYMEKYAESFHEWVDGVVIKMSPVSRTHFTIDKYLATLLDSYLNLTESGEMLGAPFVMRLEPVVRSRREPDIAVVLNGSRTVVRETYIDGPADIVVEIVSDESIERDYDDKLSEYDRGGVGEYWIIDPLKKSARFYRRVFAGAPLDVAEIDRSGYYTTLQLPRFRLHVPTLWARPLPDTVQTVQVVREMLND